MDYIENKKQVFENIYGTSCIENHVLYMLKQNNMNFSCLYHNCAIPMCEMINYFISGGGDPYAFSLIPRVHDELRKYGIISWDMSTNVSSNSLVHELSFADDIRFSLIQVTPEFTKNKLRARGFRDDHYVRVALHDKGIIIYNDIPNIVAVLSPEELMKTYTGTRVRISIERGVDDGFADLMWKDRQFKPEHFVPWNLSLNELKGEDNLGDKVRNLLIIYKIMCLRMEEYYGTNNTRYIIKDFSSAVTQSFAKLEYLRIKGEDTIEKIFDVLNFIVRQESTLMVYLQQECASRKHKLMGE